MVNHVGAALFLNPFINPTNPNPPTGVLDTDTNQPIIVEMFKMMDAGTYS